jgi:hypothetical protein
MKLHTLLGLLITTAALSACNANKGDAEVSESAIEPAPPAADIIPPSAEPSPEGALDSAMEKAGELKEGVEGAVEGAIDDAAEKAKEVITN